MAIGEWNDPFPAAEEIVITRMSNCDASAQGTLKHAWLDRECEEGTLELLIAELILKNQQFRFALAEARELIACIRNELQSLPATLPTSSDAATLEERWRHLLLLTDPDEGLNGTS